MSVSMSVFVSVCMSVCTFKCMFECMYVYMSVCMYPCTCMYAFMSGAAIGELNAFLECGTGSIRVEYFDRYLCMYVYMYVPQEQHRSGLPR